MQGLGCCTPAFVQTRCAGFSLVASHAVEHSRGGRRPGFLHISLAAAQPGNPPDQDQQVSPASAGGFLLTVPPGEFDVGPVQTDPVAFMTTLLLLLFWIFDHGAWDLFPKSRDQNPHPLALKVKSLTTGLPAKSLDWDLHIPVE